SSSSDDAFSLTKQLIEKPLGDDTFFEELNCEVIQTCLFHIPVIISSFLTSTSRPHGGTTNSRRYICRDREGRHELIINYYFKGDDSKIKQVQDKKVHKNLKKDLIDHLWELHGSHQID
ncbi:acidic fibroblast growth factor intracellular-binding protein, partial [Striga asiatica]